MQIYIKEDILKCFVIPGFWDFFTKGTTLSIKTKNHPKKLESSCKCQKKNLLRQTCAGPKKIGVLLLCILLDVVFRERKLSLVFAPFGFGIFLGFSGSTCRHYLNVP